MSLLVDTFAKAICKTAGEDPTALVTLRIAGMADGQVETWVLSRPRALGMVSAIREEIGDGGVAFLESALALVVATGKAGLAS